MIEKLKIAIVSAYQTLGTKEFKLEDLVKFLSFNRGWVSPNEARDIVNTMVEKKLLRKKDGKYVPNFSMKGIIVPLDFYLSPQDLKDISPKKGEDVFMKIVDRIISTTGEEKKKVIAEINRKKIELEYIHTPVAALLVADEKGVDCSELIEDVMREVLE